jgi:serine/threonine protein kinase
MPEIGHTISRYRILEKIGQGSMEEVCLTKDEKLGRDAAIIVVEVI